MDIWGYLETNFNEEVIEKLISIAKVAITYDVHIKFASNTHLSFSLHEIPFEITSDICSEAFDVVNNSNTIVHRLCLLINQIFDILKITSVKLCIGDDFQLNCGHIIKTCNIKDLEYELSTYFECTENGFLVRSINDIEIYIIK